MGDERDKFTIILQDEDFVYLEIKTSVACCSCRKFKSGQKSNQK